MNISWKCPHLQTIQMSCRWVSSSDLLTSEPILSIRRRLKLCRAPETPRAPFALKDDFILVSLLNLASGYENMNDHYCNAALSPFPRKISLLLETKKRVESTASRRRDNASRALSASAIHEEMRFIHSFITTRSQRDATNPIMLHFSKNDEQTKLHLGWPENEY